jgi:hypothetical protein
MNRYFKQIEGFENYYVSSNGKIFSRKSNLYLKHDNRYVVLYKDNKKYLRSVKKIIKIAFKKSD